ncbi:SIS domain-containing protein [Candidatus Pseudothioglobus singularis]|jgi:D-sedoheptulose 7-phosphate isomerase|nr:SIS domain-containing protein [Candidatus Pseudothioglobus singularis]
MNKIDQIFKKSININEFSKSYFDYLGQVLSNISLDEIESFVNLILGAREREATIFFIGNGGSAATASHFANDIAIGTRTYEKPFRVISLCDNQAVITAIANDDGYEKIFSQQLKVLLKKQDVVVAISASGNSPNLIDAINTAKKMNAISVGISAFDGGKMKEIVDFSLHVPTEKGEYGPAEDAHMILDHLIGNYLLRLVKN